MSLIKKFAVILVFMSLMVLSLVGCEQEPEKQSTVEPTSSSTSEPQPTATQKTETTPEITATNTPLGSPTSVPSPTQEVEATNAITETEILDTVFQSIPDNYNLSNANFSVIDGPSPINVKQQLGSFGGGGGFRLDIPNNCLTKHFGITYYNEPTMVEGLMSPWSSRTLQIPQKPSIWPEELPDVCTCGFALNEEVTLSLVNPLQETMYESKLTAQPVTGANGEIIEGVYCIESNIFSEFDFWPGDSSGFYKVIAEANSGTVSHEFELKANSAPYFYYSNRLGGYILGGLDPHEVVVVALYEGELLAHSSTIETDEYGVAFLEHANILGFGEDPELQAPIALFRGDPTTEYFEILTFYTGFVSPGYFVEFFAEADFSELIELNPDNPYVYYHQGDIDKFLELAPDSDLAVFVKWNELYEEAINLMDRYLFALDPIMTHVEPSDEELQLAIDYLSEVIETLEDPTKALAARADAYAMREEYVSALADIMSAASLNPDNPYFPLMEGNIHLLSGDYELAIDSFEKIIVMAPDSSEGHYKIGCIYNELGDSEQASESFLRSIEIWKDTNSPEIFSASGADPDSNYYGYLHRKDNEFDRGSCWDTYNVHKTNYLQQNSLSFDPSLYSTFHPADNMQMFYVPTGEFIMGSSSEDEASEPIEYPQHTVYLDGYWIDYQEVSVNQYALCVNAGVCNPTAQEIPEDAVFWDETPVTDIAWADASTYCEWVGRRLPTEAEWEKAARGTDSRIYPWGNSSPDTCAWNVNYDSGGVRALYYEEVNYSCVAPSGAIDMAGNAWEWVADYFGADYYTNSPVENPQGPEIGEERVVRGGSWTTSNINFLRTANRWSRPEDFSSDSIGFRCALSTDP